MELAERFATACNPVSNVRWATQGAKSRIVDLAGALFCLGELSTCDGTPLAYVDVIRALGIAFNIDIPNQNAIRYQNRNRYKGAAQFLRRLAALLEADAL